MAMALARTESGFSLVLLATMSKAPLDYAVGLELLACVLLLSHHLIYQALDDVLLGLLELLLGMLAAGMHDRLGCQVHVALDAQVCNLYLSRIPFAEYLHNNHLTGFSFLPRTSSSRETLLTAITLNLTPGISPMDRP